MIRLSCDHFCTRRRRDRVDLSSIWGSRKVRVIIFLTGQIRFRSIRKILRRCRWLDLRSIDFDDNWSILLFFNVEILHRRKKMNLFRSIVFVDRTGDFIEKFEIFQRRMSTRHGSHRFGEWPIRWTRKKNVEFLFWFRKKNFSFFTIGKSEKLDEIWVFVDSLSVRTTRQRNLFFIVVNRNRRWRFEKSFFFYFRFCESSKNRIVEKIFVLHRIRRWNSLRETDFDRTTSNEFCFLIRILVRSSRVDSRWSDKKIHLEHFPQEKICISLVCSTDKGQI